MKDFLSRFLHNLASSLTFIGLGVVVFVILALCGWSFVIHPIIAIPVFLVVGCAICTILED